MHTEVCLSVCLSLRLFKDPPAMQKESSQLLYLWAFKFSQGFFLEK